VGANDNGGQGLVTLDEAAERTYEAVCSHARTILEGERERETSLGLAAMALSMVAPIYDQDASGQLRAISAHQINERLFKVVQLEKRQRRRGLVMRVDDLEHAIELLKTANADFRPDGLRFGAAQTKRSGKLTTSS
jgi:hypothetical protein